jgi:hypothetical protein
LARAGGRYGHDVRATTASTPIRHPVHNTTKATLAATGTTVFPSTKFRCLYHADLGAVRRGSVDQSNNGRDDRPWCKVSSGSRALLLTHKQNQRARWCGAPN